MRIEVDIASRLGDFALEARFESDSLTTAIFGRSGAGKTSVLNAIAGLTKPARGRIRVGDTVFYDSSGTCLPARKRRVGYVFQDALLLPHLSVRQNLLYGRFFAPADERYTDPERIVALLDLAQLLARRPRELSGGEKQRVAIGRALLASPGLLLMDEPLASLDAARKSEILHYVERLRDDLKVPILYVSHAIEEVVRLADMLVVMSEGKVVASGSVTALAGRLDLRPHLGRFEAGAVLEVAVAEQNLTHGLARLAFDGGEILAPDVDALVGERLRVRVRARDVSLALSAPRDASFLNVLPGVVAELGDVSGTSVDVRVALGRATIVARITRRSVQALGLAPGKPVFALIKSVAIDRHSVGYA
jgi:molybdate transport system ATP-binding protein